MLVLEKCNKLTKIQAIASQQNSEHKIKAMTLKAVITYWVVCGASS